MKKKIKKKINSNQQSFFFEDYLKTNQKFRREKNNTINEDRIYLLFFSFFSLILIFSFKIIFISLQNPSYNESKNYSYNFNPVRNDIVDRNGILLSRNVTAYHAAIKPKLVKDKKKFLVKLKLVLPEIDSKKLFINLNQKKYFYLKKRLTDIEREKLWKLGEKGLIFEPFQTRVYPHANLYSHIIGQTDYDNYGISGVENYYDQYLRDKNNFDKPLRLSLDTNIQYLIQNELEEALKIFQAEGAASILMDSENGEVLSLVSLPDFNINKREDLKDKAFMNKITKGVFELGSIFKTFTVALALEEKIVDTHTIINNIKKNMKCSVHKISDIKKFPESMTVEDILVQSSNIGTVKIAKKIGEKKYKDFLKDLNLFNSPKFELDEIGSPIPFKWNKCKLETISFGHGITTTPLQAAAAYAALINGGMLISPTLEKDKNNNVKFKRIISTETSKKIKKVLRKVVTDEKGTASLADIYGYNVSGKTGTSQYYDDESKNINTFISFFTVSGKNYILLVMLDDPQIAKNLIYNYRGIKIKGTRNEAGWNAVYSSGKIIEKIGPILAINNKEILYHHVVKKTN
jgi:cell division protein FtsI (penicillin-binding protein 3)